METFDISFESTHNKLQCGMQITRTEVRKKLWRLQICKNFFWFDSSYHIKKISHSYKKNLVVILLKISTKVDCFKGDLQFKTTKR